MVLVAYAGLPPTVLWDLWRPGRTDPVMRHFYRRVSVAWPHRPVAPQGPEEGGASPALLPVILVGLGPGQRHVRIKQEAMPAGPASRWSHLRLLEELIILMTSADLLKNFNLEC
ncbi:hypothetical protein GWK47_035020 [Chionoecetes opilio]|uniref:Uncharacterized protein n=1 Tax=Chionoecetes opilio TaxID=41210 RepID=A0A8J5CZN9_CHIOP|nr:hypothetical protein GWK47_035020 [Chionoecetes opilio]